MHRVQDMDLANEYVSLNVARLASIPPSVLDVAAVKSHDLEELANQKKLAQM